jgi:protein tyrosine phosphatase (PTP) superfamily phosphohydrolase (DUF442 family)
VYTKKLLFILSLCVLSLGLAFTLFTHKGVKPEPGEVYARSLGTLSDAGPLDDLSPEVKSSLPHFHRVNENYTRGSKPAGEGVRTLRRLGIKAILDLRSAYDHTDEVRAEAERLGLTYYRLPLSVWYGPSDAEAKKFLSLVSDRCRGPFFVFCSDGIHRTGEMSAIYRIERDRWEVGRALKEMDEIGFSPYYYALRNYVWTYARKFRPEAVPRTARRIIPTDEWDRKQDRQSGLR